MRRLLTLTLIATVTACSSDTATGPDRPITAISIDPASQSLVVGQVWQLTPVVTGGFSTPVIVWKSSNVNIASVTDSGIVLAKTVGTATISATAGGITGTSTITVSSGSVTVSPSSSALFVGQSVVLSALVTGGNTTGAAVSWGSSNSNIASVDQTGRVTARGAGSATISAAASNGVGTATVTVTGGTISITPSSAALVIGQSTVLGVTVLTGPVNPTVIWSSSNTTVATVDSTGRVTAKAVGTAVISGNIGGAPSTVNVTVTAGAVDHVIVCEVAGGASCSGAATLGAVGTSTTARAAAFNQGGADITATCTFTWTPSSGAVNITFFGDATKRDALITRTGLGVVSIIVSCGNVPGVFTINGPSAP